MRILWATLAVAPFVTVAVGMLTGRVRARSCCAVPAEKDARLRVVDGQAAAAPATEPASRSYAAEQGSRGAPGRDVIRPESPK